MARKKVIENEVLKTHFLENICQTDRIWFDGNRLSGDMGWTFDEMLETSTLDLDFARNVAINELVLYRDEGNIEENTQPVYVLVEKGLDDKTGLDDDRVLELVTLIPESDEKFLAEVNECYPGAKIIHVSENQEMIDLVDDISMVKYNEKKEAVLDGLYSIMNFVEEKSENSVLSFPAIKIHGQEVNGLSYHYGIDHSVYYDLQSPGMKFPGMQGFRLEQFFTRLNVQEQDGVLDGINKAVKHLNKKENTKSYQQKL